MRKPKSQRGASSRRDIAHRQGRGVRPVQGGTVKNYSSWGRKSILTLIALLASIGLAFYLKWSAGGVTLVFGSILGLHHTANVAQAKL